ncbi:hypothetical protein [Elizabethkingia meningoseptica]|uniref:hypothetical protein n=1 Tax=Elizabethkingia meningoseptica TaxID=238 RepID=UPI003891DDD4
MKKIIIAVLFFSIGISCHVLANETDAQKNEISIISFEEETIDCINYYSVTQVDCAGAASTVHLGGNRGDCGGSQDGEILFHNTTVSSCNGTAVASSVISLTSIAATIACLF